VLRLPRRHGLRRREAVRGPGAVPGWLGWGVLAVGLFLGFLLGGLFGIALLLRGSGGRKTAVPFGPFMLLGVLIAVLTGEQLVDGYLSLTGL
jgi:leader peptidase (prepilin peptidase)/N-methyltransferase